MSTTDESTTDSLEGSIVNVMHVDNSGTDPIRTVLALADKDNLSMPIDENDEDFDPASKRRTKRFRTNNTITVEVTSAIATDLDALETVGIVDSDGVVSFDPADRDWGSDYHLELGYSNSEMDYSNDPGPADFDLVHRGDDIKVVAGDVDPSTTPIEASMTFWIEGDLDLDADAL